MKVSFWGVRGSLACSSPDILRYGGNTACIAVELDNGHFVVLDAGTGINMLGDRLIQRQLASASSTPSQAVKTCSIILSHGHWDHIMGLPFFKPLYDPEWEVTVYACAGIGGCGLTALMENLFNPALFPVPWHSLREAVRLVEVPQGEVLELPGARALLAKANHNEGAVATRLEADGYCLFYSGDHELGFMPPPWDAAQLETPFFRALRGADMAIVDSMYTLREYERYQGWGHSALEQWPPLAKELEVGTLVFTHFNPSYNDAMLDDIHDSLCASFPDMTERMLMAYQGLRLQLPLNSMQEVPDRLHCLRCEITHEFLNMTEMGHIFDSLLSKARDLTSADAGTLYLMEEGRLVFAYSQNETLYTASDWARQQYLNATLPVDSNSIAGFVALHGATLNLKNVRDLPEGVPYSFNDRFDKMTGYCTVSMCSLPIHSLEGNLVGVLQLINCKQNNMVRPFSSRLQRLGEELCHVGAQAIERGMRIQDMILRMLQTSALRDPTETGGHVKRVGAMVAEIYQKWGERHGLTMQEMRERKGQLRLAAMLHDVGKVGIADAILKKPGRLDPEERAEMETHACKGAQLFAEPHNTVDSLAHNIALHHHQKWNGSGYTGDPEVPILSGTDIPLEARLTAVADVYDALVSPRCYKDPWPVEKALELLKKESGSHFDPEVVSAFLEIHDTMIAIHAKYLG